MDLGSVVELSTDHLFISSGQLKYRWTRIIKEQQEKLEDEECFKNIDSNILVINDFESRYAGTYRCVISSSNKPTVSMSAEVELDLPGKLIARFNGIPAFYVYYTEPPEEFSTKMSDGLFMLYLNANGIHYDVCKKLKSKLEII